MTVHFPNFPSPTTIALGVTSQHMNMGEDANIQSITNTQHSINIYRITESSASYILNILYLGSDLNVGHLHVLIASGNE